MISLPSDQDASGRTFDCAELALVAEVLESGTLTSTKGTMTRRLEEAFADQIGVRYVRACASGTAALHAAIAAVDPEPGDEIVTSPITDMGALTPILYQGAAPVFADVDPAVACVTACTIEPRLSERTRAIVVTHLFGNPCHMEPIMALARARGVPVIEDCAQAFLASDCSRLVGSIGTIGVFSLQQGKHVTCGEGGLITTSDDELAERMSLFINKAWPYGDHTPDHRFLALNYRLSEIQAAVALGQLGKLASSVERRIANAEALHAALVDIPGVSGPTVRPDTVHSYWRFPMRVQADAIRGGAAALGAKLNQIGIHAAPRYIAKPAFECELFQRQQTFGNSRWPFTMASSEAVDYRRSRFPGVFAALDSTVVLPWNERFEPVHIRLMARAIGDAASELARSS
jgi:dTDP-4-amino-4,6-dideoxygalactose transaminase